VPDWPRFIDVNHGNFISAQCSWAIPFSFSSSEFRLVSSFLLRSELLCFIYCALKLSATWDLNFFVKYLLRYEAELHLPFSRTSSDALPVLISSIFLLWSIFPSSFPCSSAFPALIIFRSFSDTHPKRQIPRWQCYFQDTHALMLRYSTCDI
jgi:hypothetical protein